MQGPVTGAKMMTFTVEVGDPVIVGEVGGQVRRYVPLLGGKVDGDYSGIIIPGGMDWQTVMPNGCVEISARYALELEQGRVEVRSKGLRAGAPGVLARIAAGEIVPGSKYYFRTAMRFSSGSLELAALNQILAIAIGERFPNYVTLGIYPVL